MIRDFKKFRGGSQGFGLRKILIGLRARFSILGDFERGRHKDHWTTCEIRHSDDWITWQVSQT